MMKCKPECRPFVVLTGRGDQASLNPSRPCKSKNEREGGSTKSGKKSCSTARREFAAINAYRAHMKRECVPLISCGGVGEGLGCQDKAGLEHASAVQMSRHCDDLSFLCLQPIAHDCKTQSPA